MIELQRIKLEDFCQFFDENLKEKYETQGLKSLRGGLQALMNSVGDTK